MHPGKMVYRTLFLLFFLLTGCVNISSTTTATTTAVGIDGIRCVGDITVPPPGLVEVNDSELLKQSLGISTEGRLCAGKVYMATEPVTVYRVWNKDKSYTLYGSWWSFDEPEGPRPAYRKDNGVCPSGAPWIS